jgi:hypothetical protein
MENLAERKETDVSKLIESTQIHNWNEFVTKVQEKIKIVIESNQNIPYSYFHFKNNEDISNYQREKTGLVFPCGTNNVLSVNMLYGKRFVPSESKEERSYSSINRLVSKTDLTTLSGKTDPNSHILFQIQSRGIGKTKAIYDLGMKQDVIYFDMACDSSGRLSKYSHISRCFDLIAKLIEKSDREKVYDKCMNIRAQACIIMQKLMLAGLLHHGIFRQIYPNVTPEYFFRYAMEDGVGIICDVFRYLLDYDINFVREIAKQFDTIDKVFAYDEVGCVINLFEGKFLSADVKRGENISEDSFRGFFDVFAECLLSMRQFRSHQVLCGTKTSIPMFLREQVAVLNPIMPFTSSDIKEIINYYFPTLQFDSQFTNRWSGRGIAIMQYFVEKFTRLAIFRSKTNNLQEVFALEEAGWFRSSIPSNEESIGEW